MTAPIRLHQETMGDNHHEDDNISQNAHNILNEANIAGLTIQSRHQIAGLTIQSRHQMLVDVTVKNRSPHFH